MRNEPVCVAIVGCGRIAGHHCRSIRDVEGIELAAVCDLVEEKARAYGKDFQVPHFVSYREMFRSVPRVNTVVIATPSGMHFEHGMDMLERYHKHIIVEKPTFMRPSQLVAIYRLADRLGLHIFPVFQNRHNRAVRRVSHALRDGELGPVRLASVRVRWCRPQRYYELAPWRGTYAQDGGALTNQGIHHLDLMRHLGGEIVRVSASMKTLGADIEVEDSVVGMMQFASGALGVLEVTTAARPADFEASLSLVCERGLAQIGGIAVNELQVFTPDPDACAAWSEDFSGNIYGHGHRVVYEDIANCWHRGQPYPIDRLDCLKTLKLLHAFYLSDECGGWVEVDDPEESLRLGRSDDALADIYRTPTSEGERV